MGQGTGQILVYAVVLIALSYPLGIWMARVYTRERGDVVERGFLRLLGSDAGSDQDWKAYGKSVLVFSIFFSVFLYGIQRLQGHLFLNPDHIQAVPWAVALNTAASFVTNTNWQYYGGESTMSYLSQMAGLAVQHFVSAGGRARRARGRDPRHRPPLQRRRARQLLARPLPVDRLHPAAARDRPRGDPDLAGRAADLPRARDRDDPAGRDQTIARGPVASQIAIKQLGTNGGGYYNSNSAVPFENPTALSNFLEMLAILLIPAAQVVHVREDGARAAARLGGVRGLFVDLRASASPSTFPSEQHGSQVLRDSGVNITRSAASRAGTCPTRRFASGIANTAHLDGRDERRLERLGQRRLRRAHSGRRRGARSSTCSSARSSFGGVGSGLYGHVLLHRDRGVRRRADGRANS